MAKETLNIAAVGDIHCDRESHGCMQALFRQLPDRTDIVLLCGDVTDYGLPEEAHIVAREITSAVKVPVLAVFGNHDYESGQQEEVRKILADNGIRVLDGETFELEGIGFVGVKGFGGGFDRRMLEPWGEPAIKSFVHEAVDEALKLERGLAKLRTSQRVVLMHYSPIQATIEGEPCETYPFLGSSRLEDPINRYGVTAVFHGHAHHGVPEGQTREGIPVFNVSAPLLKRHYPDSPPFRVLSLPVPSSIERETADITE